MKIVIIANGYPNTQEPQWGCFERDQALALSGLGHNVSILYVDRRFRKYWRKVGVTRIQENNIFVYGMFWLPLGWFRDKISYRLHQKIVMFMYDRLYRVMVKHQGTPDIIYAHYQWNISYASIIKDKYRVPLVGIEHWSGMANETLPPISVFQGNLAYSKVDELLAVSKSLQSHIFWHFNKKSVVVYDMLGQEFFSSKIIRRGLHEDKFQFIAIGSLIPRKGFDLLLKAFSESKLVEKGCCIIIVGSGPERDKLQKQSELLGISEAVKLVGSKTKKEIIRLLQDSHAFVLPSRAETFGVVCIEALSQGLPSIATICGGPEEFVNEKNGILIPSENAGALSDAMIKMYNNYNTFDLETIADDCKQRFAPQVIAKQLISIFENVIDN